MKGGKGPYIWLGMAPCGNGSFECRFVLHGLRHVNPLAIHRAQELQEGEGLQVAVEVNNPATGIAIFLQTQDYMPLGWAPRYLVTDLLNAMSGAPVLNAKVVKANSPSTPINRR